MTGTCTCERFCGLIKAVNLFLKIPVRGVRSAGDFCKGGELFCKMIVRACDRSRNAGDVAQSVLEKFTSFRSLEM